MSRAIIFAGGKIDDYSELALTVENDDFIICADSGVNHCCALGLEAKLWVGDFDSADFSSDKQKPAVKNARIVKLNPEKDDTDTEHSIDLAVKMGFKSIVLVAGIGTRFDHSIANVFLMEKYHDEGIELIVLNDKNIIRFVRDNEITIKKTCMKYVSIISLDKEAIVSCSGFKYPLSNDRIYRCSSRGISNELTECSGTITVHKGSILIIQSTD